MNVVLRASRAATAVRFPAEVMMRSKVASISVSRRQLSTGPDPATAAAVLAANGEPALSSLGLAHGYPSGWVQAILEVVHVHGALPWWAAIACTTLTMRVIMFPVVIKAQRNMALMNNVTPELQKIQMKIIDSKTQEETMTAHQELRAFYRIKGVSPIKSAMPLMTNGVVFTSMFFGIRAMAQVPVESMKLGGMGWFMDLTVADPIFLLPFITASSLMLNIKLGADGVSVDQVPKLFRTYMMTLPIISFPIMCQFPAALNVYWLTTNLISVAQTVVVRHPKVREKLGIPKLIQWKPEDLPMDNFGLGSISKIVKNASKDR